MGYSANQCKITEGYRFLSIWMWLLASFFQIPGQVFVKELLDQFQILRKLYCLLPCWVAKCITMKNSIENYIIRFLYVYLIQSRFPFRGLHWQYSSGSQKKYFLAMEGDSMDVMSLLSLGCITKLWCHLFSLFSYAVCLVGSVMVGGCRILRVQKLHIVGNNCLCWKGLDSKWLNIFSKDIVVLGSLFYLCHVGECSVPSVLKVTTRRSRSMTVLTACSLSFTSHFKPIHVTASCGGTHTKLNIWSLYTFSKADSESRGKICVDSMVSVLVGSVAR